MNFFASGLRTVAASLVVVTLSLLGGCAVYSTVDDPLKLAPQSDLVPIAVSITANTDEINGFDKIQLERAEPGERLKIAKLVTSNLLMKKVVPGMARDTSLFIGALPPGEYEFTELLDTTSRKSLRVYALGRFIVESGKPADLGRLIVTNVDLRVSYGRSKLVSSNAELMQRFAPDYAKLFSTTGGRSGWLKPTDDYDRTEEFARSHPAAATCLTEMTDGRVAAASRMGAVLIRGNDERWRPVNSPHAETLSCVLPVDLPNAELLAVGEFGIMVRKPRDSDQLLPIDSGNLPPGNLLAIGGDARHGWYVVHRKINELSIFHAQQLEAGNWTLVNQYTLPGSWGFGMDAFWIWQDKNSIGYALESGSIVQVDFATGKLSERSGPPDAKLAGFRHLPDGTETILVKAGLAGRFPDAYFSRDRETWTQIVSPFKVLVSPVIPLPDGRLLLEAGMYNEPALHVSADNGKTWSHYAKYDFHGAPLLMPSGLLFKVGGGFRGIVTISSSADAGRTWKPEHSSFVTRRYGER